MTSPLYNIELSYDANSEGPSESLPPVPDEVVAADLQRTLLGLPVGYPIGIPASPLTANSAWIRACGNQGFNVLTYKTVRNKSTPALPAPNWLFPKALSKPLPIGVAPGPVQVDRARRHPTDPRAYSMINSCGVPSLEPDDWKRDIQRALQVIRPGQVLLVSVVGDYEKLRGRDLVHDFVSVALHVEAAGAPIVELNLSCPNSVNEHLGPKRRGELLPPICQSATDSQMIVEAVREALAPTTKLVAKLGYLTRKDLSAVLAAIGGSVDGIAGINTLQVPVADDSSGPVFVGTLKDPDEPRRQAGLSGIAIRDYALDFVHSLALLRRQHSWDFEIIAMGGVMEPHDVRALMAMGADAVQTATAAENNPELPRQLCSDGHYVPSEEERLVNLVFAALSDPRWEFRTAEGLASELDLTQEQVRQILESHGEFVRRSVATDRLGRDLYTTHTRKPTIREKLEQLRWMLAR